MILQTVHSLQFLLACDRTLHDSLTTVFYYTHSLLFSSPMYPSQSYVYSAYESLDFADEQDV